MNWLGPVPIRCASLIDAPVSVVRRVLRRSDVWVRAATALGAHLEIAGNPAAMYDGALVRFRSATGRRMLLRVVDRSGVPMLESAIDTGRRHVRVRVALAQTAAGTLTTVEFVVATAVPLLNLSLRPLLVGYGEMLLGITTLAVREPVRVVAGAVVHNGKVLLARRKLSGVGSGRWELPGGKVEPGETDEQALQRELVEELAIHTRVFRRVGGTIEVEPGVELVCYRAEMITRETPTLVDHDLYQWVGPDELDTVELLEADSKLVESLRAVLQMLS
jgi:8-oxo-dGTP diphosphatase